MAPQTRLLIFVLLMSLPLSETAAINNGPHGFRETYERMGQVAVTPFVMGVSKSITFGPLCVAAMAIRKIENCEFSECALPGRLELKKNRWTSFLSTFLTISSTKFSDDSTLFCYGGQL